MKATVESHRHLFLSVSWTPCRSRDTMTLEHKGFNGCLVGCDTFMMHVSLSKARFTTFKPRDVKVLLIVFLKLLEIQKREISNALFKRAIFYLHS